MSQRPTVSVYSAEKPKEVVATVAMPDVFTTPIRAELVSQMHAFQLLNLRHPYAVNFHTGMQHSAESWGTGRAVARIPRVSGGGTHAAGSGAFGNQCRGGRMFAPTKVWRKWSHVIKQNERRYAIASAIAASSVAPLVMARGHKIEKTRECPLVLSNDVETYTKTKQAVALLKKLGVYDDVKKVKESKEMRAGKGKRRNRRFRQRRGPLVVYKNNSGVVRAFRNIPGVEVASVERVNLFELAPGGKVGRFVIWTQGAFEELQKRFGSYAGAVGTAALKRRHGVAYRLPRPQMVNTDVAALIKSDAVQNVIRPVKITKAVRNSVARKNPLKNQRALAKLNPQAASLARRSIVKKAQAAAGVVSEQQKKKAANRAALEKKIHAAFYEKYLAALQ